ncbi:MAG: hypothetical protein AB2693_25750 [Candidatus Thiodiazotropha sp.]
MAVMDIGVPSGFEASKQGISAVVDGKDLVRRLERRGDRLNIYFDQVILCTKGHNFVIPSLLVDHCLYRRSYMISHFIKRAFGEFHKVHI